MIAINRAVWCDVIQLKLWKGASNEFDYKTLRDMQIDIRSLEMTAEVWNFSFAIAAKCRPKGIAVPTADMMIFACAQVHGVEIYHHDDHYNLLATVA